MAKDKKVKEVKKEEVKETKKSTGLEISVPKIDIKQE